MLFSDRRLWLCLVTAVASVWLCITGQLDLYINPRYILFTAVMAVLTLAMLVLGATYAADEHAHRRNDVDEFGPHDKKTPRYKMLAGMASFVICGLLAAGLLLLKPSTLGTAAVGQRGINSGSLSAADASTSKAAEMASPLFAGQDYSNLSIKDWSGLLSLTTDPSYFAGKQTSLTGFVTPDPSDRQNIFYVSRFVVTCCVVDARPVGVAVYLPNWQSTYKPDSWVELHGSFIANPSAANTEAVVLEPDTIRAIKQPDNPYEY